MWPLWGPAHLCRRGHEDGYRFYHLMQKQHLHYVSLSLSPEKSVLDLYYEKLEKNEISGNAYN